MLRAIDIFSNPYGLVFEICDDKLSGGFGFSISLETENGNKPLISNESFFERFCDAQDKVREILEGIWKSLCEELEKSDAVMLRLRLRLSPNKEPLDEHRFLSPELINRILDALQSRKIVVTKDMQPVGA